MSNRAGLRLVEALKVKLGRGRKSDGIFHNGVRVSGFDAGCSVIATVSVSSATVNVAQVS